MKNSFSTFVLHFPNVFLKHFSRVFVYFFLRLFHFTIQHCSIFFVFILFFRLFSVSLFQAIIRCIEVYQRKVFVYLRIKFNFILMFCFVLFCFVLFCVALLPCSLYRPLGRTITTQWNYFERFCGWVVVWMSCCVGGCCVGWLLCG